MFARTPYNSKFKPRILFLGPMLGKHFGLIPNPAEELAPLLEKDGFSCMLASSFRNRYFRLFDMVSRLILSSNRVGVVSLQVYSGQSVVPEVILSGLARVLRLKLLMVLHGGAIPEFVHKHPRVMTCLLNRADSIVTPSHFIARELSLRKINCQVIPNGLDLTRYHFLHRRTIQPRIAWLRGFHKTYAPEIAVRVLYQVLQCIPTARLGMIGPAYDDGSLEETKALARELGIAGFVDFVGPVPKTSVPSVLSEYDIFLNTTRYESFGISVMEAAAEGLPIVTTDVGELRHLWQNGKNAIVSAVDDVNSLSNAIIQLTKDKEIVSELSLAARRTAERYDWRLITPQWEKLFVELSTKP